MGALVTYSRVSTSQQGKSGLGIEAQREALARFAEAEGFETVAEFIEVETGKGADALDRRPQLAAALAEARRRRWPTGEIAERDARTQEFRGWYWQDHLDAERKLTRLFLPNYFNTFCVRLRADSLYAKLVGNRSTVLRLMGNVEEADQHLQEAEDFMPPNGRPPTSVGV
jgi:hypothetical protein